MCVAKYAALSTDVRRGQLVVRCADAVTKTHPELRMSSAVDSTRQACASPVCSA